MTPGQHLADIPGIDGIAVCDCGATAFYVALGLNLEGLENRIKLLACVACDKRMPVPFQQGRSR